MSYELIPASIPANFASATIQLSDDDLLPRLTNTEDSTVERKVTSDYRDCLKTAIAFSNSLPIGDPGVIFVGVYDDGRVQDNSNLDGFQKKVSEELNKAYPPLYPQLRTVRSKDGKEFLAVIVRGSPDRPHFAGQAYIRDGSRILPASAHLFAQLIAERNSKVREISMWKGKEIVFRLPPGDGVIIGNSLFRGGARAACRIIDCGQFFVTVELTSGGEGARRAYPLSFIEIGYDCENSCLELIGLQL